MIALKIIPHEDLVDMGRAAWAGRFRIDLPYADKDHPENLFKCAFYDKDTCLWLHRELAFIVAEAALLVQARLAPGGRMVLKDGLRPVEAQARMMNCDFVKSAGHILEGPQPFLSQPGRGGHPRGMAIDVGVEDERGNALDFGTPFDFFSPDPDDNPAARDYPHAPEIMERRQILEQAFIEAGMAAGRIVVPLSHEWWDFRLEPAFFNAFAPIEDAGLPPSMRMMKNMANQD